MHIAKPTRRTRLGLIRLKFVFAWSWQIRVRARESIRLIDSPKRVVKTETSPEPPICARHTVFPPQSSIWASVNVGFGVKIKCKQTWACTVPVSSMLLNALSEMKYQIPEMMPKASSHVLYMICDCCAEGNLSEYRKKKKKKQSLSTCLYFPLTRA